MRSEDIVPITEPARQLRSELRAGCFAFACFAAGFAVFFGRSVLTGNYIAPSDSLDFGLASFLSPQRFWTEGMFSGYPIAADPQALMWYLPFRVLRLLASPGAWNAFMVMPYVVAATGAFLLVRRMTRSTMGGALSGVAFGYSGIMLAHISHFNQIHAASWLPMLVYGLLLIREERLRAGILTGSAALALMITAGHPQVVVYSMYVLAAVVVAWTAIDGFTAARVRRRAFGTSAMVVFGIGLAAALVVPTLELAALSPRAEANWVLYSSKPLPPWQLLTLAWPFSFGGFSTPTGVQVPYLGDSSPGEMTGYAGLLPLSLALMGPFLLTGRVRREAAVWSGVALVALLLCLGTLTPVGAAFFYAPGYASFRVPARHFFVVTFGLSVAAGVVFSELAAVEPRKIGWAVLLTGILALLGGWALVAANSHVRELLLGDAAYLRWAATLPTVVGVLLVSIAWVSERTWPRIQTRLIPAAFIVVLVAELTIFHYMMPGYRLRAYAEVTADDVTPSREIVNVRDEILGTGDRVLAADGSRNQFFRPNLPRAWNMAAATGTGSLPVNAYVETLGLGGPGDIDPDVLAGPSPAIDLYSVRYVLIPEVWPVAAQLERDKRRWTIVDRLPYLEQNQPSNYVLLRNARALPRAWCVFETVALDPGDTRNAIRSGAVGGRPFDATRTAFVEEGIPTRSAAAGTQPAAVVMRPAGRDERRVEVTTSQECLLIVSDPHYPWWRGSIDNQPARLDRVNLSMIGVAIPPGRHDVRLWLEPRSVWAGLTISGVALLTWLWLAVSGAVRRTPTAA